MNSSDQIINLVLDLNKKVRQNEAYRYAIVTTTKSQLVLMNLKPSEEIGEKIHQGDRFIYIIQGRGAAVLWLKGKNEKEIQKVYDIFPGIGVTIPAGTRYNIYSGSDDQMKLFTIYTPPEHGEDTYQVRKPT